MDLEKEDKSAIYILLQEILINKDTKRVQVVASKQQLTQQETTSILRDTKVNNKQIFRPLKRSDLKGSSIWKGSAGGSLAPLLLNMAILDFNELS